MHRRRLAAMATFLEHVLALPASFHWRSRSGRLMRVMISGVDTLFGFRLPPFRQQIGNIARIIALDNGAIVETRTFDELVAQSGVFAGLARDAGVSSLRRPLPETLTQDNAPAGEGEGFMKAAE